MSITATPTLTVGGVAVAGALTDPGAASLVAIDTVQWSWGRESVLEQPRAATATLTVLDRSAGAAFARRTDLIGTVIVLGWRASTGATGVTFRGRITDAQVSPLRPSSKHRGFSVALSASSIEVDLANYKMPEGTVWPAETFAARANRVRGVIPAGLIAGGLTLPTRFDLGLQYSTTPDTDLDTYTAAQVDVSGADVLALIRKLYASYSPLPAVYSPATDGYTFPARRRLAYGPGGFTASAMLRADPDHAGRYIAASLSGLHLDAGATEYAGVLTQQIDSRLTRVEVNYLDETAAYDTRTTAEHTADAVGVESQIGRRTMVVDTWHATAARADQLVRLYADVASVEARTPRLAAIGYSSAREPLHDVAHATLLLAGAESSSQVFLGRSWLTALGQRPLVGVLGAAVSYAGGQWSSQLTPAPTFLDPSPGAWSPVTVAASALPGVRLRDIDPSVTFGDLAFVDIGAGFTTDTALPYKGNPT